MKCRHCGRGLDLPFLDLGNAPPSNAYLSEAALRAPEVTYPLRLLVCDGCWLVQTEDYAGREQLFDADYAYFSSVSTSWLDHARRYVTGVVRRFELDGSSTVAEVAANDGYLLQYVRAAGIPCYGVEPTASTAAAARSRGLDIVERFFGADLAGELVTAGRSADLIVANNVLAHVPDINDFLDGFRILLKPSGVATFEFPHLLRMVADNEFDTAYHEHFSYLSLTFLQSALARAGLQMFDVESLSTHGGSLRVYVQRSACGAHSVSPAVGKQLAEERAAGVGEASFYRSFQARAESVKNDFLAFLLQARQRGHRVAGYGAAAKGNTLLNFAGVRRDLLPYVVDRSASKVGRYLPGSRIPILPVEVLRERAPDYLVVLPWNIAAEVAAQTRDLAQAGMRYVTAVPSLRVS